MVTLTAWALYLTVAAVGMAVNSGNQAAYGYLTGNINRWKKDALAFVRECIGAHPDKWQAEALRLVSDPSTRRLAFKACKGPGKTAVLAWIILWFLTCHVNSKVGCTSITEGNIDTNLWPELFNWMEQSPFLTAMFTWSTTHVRRRGKAGANWFAVKRTWPKTGDAQQQANALAGIHANDVMFVLDESGGIPQAVMVTAEAVLANFTEAMEAAGHRAVVVQAGNPTHTTGPLFRACTTDRKLWKVITITGDPDDPNRSPRISLKWAREQIASYGRDNPWVMVNVLGEFPPASINALLGVEDVERAMRRRLDPDTYEWTQKRIGVDVARFGDDRTVLFPRQGKMSWRPTVMRNMKTTQISARVAAGATKWGGRGEIPLIFVDDTFQWGKAICDQLGDAGFNTVPVNYSLPAPNPRFKNVRSQMYFDGAEAIKAGAALPYMPELVPELTEITYVFVGGVFQLEPKELFKARLGFSPDLADAYMQTYAMPDVPADLMAKLGLTQSGGRVKRDADPYPDRGNPHDDYEGHGRVEHDKQPW